MSSGLDVAIHLTATNGVSSILAVISKDVLGLHGNVNKLQQAFANLKPAIVGAAAILAGSGMLAGVAKLVEHGNALYKIQRDMGQAGVSNVQVQEAYNKAWALTSTYTNMSAVDIMKMANDARMTFGSQDVATAHLEPFVQMAAFLKSYEGGRHSGGSQDIMGEVNAAMKSGELAGKIVPSDMIENVKQLTAMKVAYGEGLKIHTFLAAQRTAGVALRNSSDAFRYGMFPALVQEQGTNAGTMLMTAFNKIVAGTGNRTKSLEHMREIGLLKNGEDIEYDKAGRVKGLKTPDGIKGSTDAAINFGAWVNDTLKPLLDKQTAGLDPQHANIKEAQLISAMFPDRNAAKAITEIIQQFSKLTKDASQMAAARKAMDAASYNAASWDYQVQSFETQWENLMTALGAPSVGSATAALAKVNSIISGISGWVALNPGVAKAIVASMAIVGAGLVAFGVVMVGGAIVAAIGFIGPIGAGIAAVSAAIVGLGVAVGLFKPGAFSAIGTYISGLAKEWLTGFKQAFDGFKNFKPGEIVSGLAKTFNAALANLPGMVAGAIGTAISGIGSALASAISGLGAGLTGAGGQGRGHTPVGVPRFQQHSSYAPPSSGAGRKVAAADVYLDGNKVGKVMDRRTAMNNRSVNSAADHDGRASWTHPEYANG